MDYRAYQGRAWASADPGLVFFVFFVVCPPLPKTSVTIRGVSGVCSALAAKCTPLGMGGSVNLAPARQRRLH